MDKVKFQALVGSGLDPVVIERKSKWGHPASGFARSKRDVPASEAAVELLKLIRERGPGKQACLLDRAPDDQPDDIQEILTVLIERSRHKRLSQEG